MTKARPLTVSLPLGLFGTATMSMPKQDSLETTSAPSSSEGAELDLRHSIRYTIKRNAMSAKDTSN
jgi:hypothetical protein